MCCKKLHIVLIFLVIDLDNSRGFSCGFRVFTLYSFVVIAIIILLQLYYFIRVVLKPSSTKGTMTGSLCRFCCGESINDFTSK